MSLTVHLPKPVLWGLALVPSAVLAAITAAVISVAAAASSVRERDLPAPADPDEDEPELAPVGDPDVRLVTVERPAQATVVSLVKPARPSRSYCTFHGYTGCICGDAA